MPTKRISRIFDIGDLRSGHFCDLPIITRALEGGLRITPSGGGGTYNAPPSISAPMRASATNFGGYLGPY